MANLTVEQAIKKAAEYGKSYTDGKTNPLASSISNLSSALNALGESLEAEVSEVDSKTIVNSGLLEEYKALIDSNTEDISGLADDIAGNTSSISNVSSRVTALDAKVERYKVLIDTNKSGINSINSDMGDIDDLDFDADNIVDAVNKAYVNGGSGGSNIIIDGTAQSVQVPTVSEVQQMINTAMGNLLGGEG